MNRKQVAKRIFSSLVVVAVIAGALELYRIGMIDPTIVISTLVSAGIIAVISGILLYKFISKKLSGSMLGGFM